MEHPPDSLTKDRGTQLAEERTSLALNRTFLAAERTLMAWMRTALSMISFGFTMIKFFQYLDSTRGPIVGPLGRTWTPEAVGFSMMTIGTASLIVALVVHRKEMKTLRQGGLKGGWSLAFVVASLVALLGLFALVSILLGH
jgi:putative membrane protein